MSIATIERPAELRVSAEPGAGAARRSRHRLGLGALSVAGMALGAAGVVVAHRMAQSSNGQGHFAVFWVSYGMALAASLALALRARSTATRIGALVSFGSFTFVPKLVMTFDGPRYFDEYGHWRHVNDMVERVALFVPTPYQPIQDSYPGLEAFTAAVHWLTRLPTWHAGQLVVVAAHCGALVAVWWMARLVDLPHRAAVVAAFIYALNPNFLFFDTQYSYESLGLPLAFIAVALALASRRAVTARQARWSAAGAVVVGSATVVTHHSSMVVMTGLLVIVAAVVPPQSFRRSDPSARWAPWIAAASTLAVAAVWLLTVARPTYGYIEPHVRAWLGDAVNLLQGEGTRRLAGGEMETRRELFGGNDVPFYELVSAFLAPLLVIAALGSAVWEYRRDRVDAAARFRLLAPFYCLAVLYGLSLPLTLVATGSETAHRAWGFAYLGVAVVVASAVRQWDAVTARLPGWRTIAVASVALFIVAVGNTAAGSNVLYRFAGPEEFGTDTRSRTAEVDELVAWMDANLPDGSKVITDRFTGLAVTGYSDLQVPRPQDYLVWRIYREGGNPTPRLREYLRDAGFRYFVLDDRIGRLEPKQRLFQSYIGPESVSRSALETVGTTPFLRVVHRTATYSVLRIVP